MARKPTSSRGSATRGDRARSGGSSAAAPRNQSGRFGGSTASRSRGESQSADPGAGRRGFASMNTEQRHSADRRAADREWEKETRSDSAPGNIRWMSAVDLVDTPASRRAPKAEDKPGPSGRRGTRGQGGWAAEKNEPAAQRIPREGDPSYEAHSQQSAPRRSRARRERDDVARDGNSARGATVMDSGVGRRGAAGSQDERPAPRNRRSPTSRKKR
ncbi:MAG: hypothetical protein C0518_13335 [Opitutus sp.]|nr:hypothetical protein [Opitutus sp.]